MNPPAATAQEKKISTHDRKGRLYTRKRAMDSKKQFTGALFSHKLKEPYVIAIRFTAKWYFPKTKSAHDGQYKTTKPTLSNLQKMLKDGMTDLGFWKDDALIASTTVEKYWSNTPSIYIRIEKV